MLQCIWYHLCLKASSEVYLLEIEAHIEYIVAGQPHALSSKALVNENAIDVIAF